MNENSETSDSPLLSERIRLAVADEIMGGLLPPGQQLDEVHLGARFGSSRTPVREALRQLAAAGLVEMRPRRGAIVTRVTAERIIEMFEASAEFEAMCVRLATYRMSPVERSRLMRLHHESEAMVEAGDVEAYERLNWEFHQTIYEGTHNTFLAEEARSLRDRMAAFRRAQLRESSRPRRSRHEHGEVLDAVMRGNGEEAASHMRAHMLNAAVAMERLVAEKFGTVGED